MSLANGFSMTPPRVAAPTRGRSAGWLMAFLVLFSALPLSLGVLRLLQLAGISQVMPAAMAPRLPLVLHIAGALVYALLGAFQFSPSIRRRWPVLHRASGRLSLAGALLVVVSALWLTAIYASPTAGGLVLAMLRVAVASAIALSIGLGVAAAIRRDIVRHRQWMIRAYALGLGSATQMLVLMAAEIATGGPPTDLNRALLVGLAWGINLVVAERHIRRLSRGSQLAFRARTRCEPGAFRHVPQPPILNFAIIPPPEALTMTKHATVPLTPERTTRAAIRDRFGFPEVVHPRGRALAAWAERS